MGNIVPWASAQEVTFRSWTHASYGDRGSPLGRIAELFNVNHFIVSQARPYIVPFLRSDLHRSNARQSVAYNITSPLLKLLTMEIHHRLNQLDSLGFLPIGIRRFLIDENIPGASLTLVPELTPMDFARLLENPTKESLDYWILRGERSVWPAEAALRVRCAVEVELDRGYQVVRTHKPLNFTAGLGGEGQTPGRARAASVGAS
jgi:TAG lipase / lysophosphatidylethanolamine acyltransferase